MNWLLKRGYLCEIKCFLPKVILPTNKRVLLSSSLFRFSLILFNSIKRFYFMIKMSTIFKWALIGGKLSIFSDFYDDWHGEYLLSSAIYNYKKN
jgi:hypothetical protein